MIIDSFIHSFITCQSIDPSFIQTSNHSLPGRKTDRESGRSKGFGFVEFTNDEDAQAAINELNGKDVGGRALKINEARPRNEESSGGRGGRGGRGGGYR